MAVCCYVSRRNIFNWAHRIVGVIALVMAGMFSLCRDLTNAQKNKKYNSVTSRELQSAIH